MAGTRETILIRISGPDQAGITTSAMGILASAEAAIQDVEQIVVRGKLTLEIVVDVPSGKDVLKDVLLLGWERGLDVDFELVDAAPIPSLPTLVVSMIGPDLGPTDLEKITAAIAKANGNIERIQRLAKSPVWCYEFEVHGGDLNEMRTLLMDSAADSPRFDVAVQKTGLSRRAQRLVVLDVDSTLIQNEMIDLLADQANIGAECAAITEAAMAGQIDFEESLRQRVALLAGQPEEIIDLAYDQLELTEGAETFVRTLKRLGYKVAIVSGGFTSFTDRLKDRLDIDHSHANTLERRRGLLTGGLSGPIVDRAMKAELLKKIADIEGIALEQVVAVGDGANDLDMLAAAGLGVAFCAKRVVREAADTTLSTPHLDAVLFMLGVRHEELVEDIPPNSDAGS
jgi:phosphoserine phosphatase